MPVSTIPNTIRIWPMRTLVGVTPKFLRYSCRRGACRHGWEGFRTLSRQVKAHLRKMGTDRVINSCYGGAQLTRARSVRRRYTLTSTAADSGEPAQPRVGETRV